MTRLKPPLPGIAGFCNVSGTFYRAVDPQRAEFGLSGSRGAGRFSRPTEPTLYVSSSRAGAAAAMIAHRGNRSPELQMVAFEVVATNVIDLREVERLATFDVDARSAPAPWQEDADADGTPDSWRVRDALVSLGASGLIDPSRKRLDLLHLALFAWNTAGAPSVRRLS